MALTMVKPEEMEAQAGTKLPPGEWFEVDQERINTFADCTEDHQFIHIDEAAAAQTPFGGTIAHGFFNAVADDQALLGKWRISGRDCDGRELRARQGSFPKSRASG